MRRSSIAVLVLVALVASSGCKRKKLTLSQPPPENAAVDSIDSADASIAEPFADEAEGLSFKIVAVYTDQHVTADAPWHAPGGTWTFFDAKTSDGARFGFGFDRPRSATSYGFSFGKVILTAPDGESGKKLTQSIATTFHGKVPPAKPPTPIAPRPISAAYLAIDAQRGVSGFTGSGTGGGYYAMKLFLQRDAIEAEVFFNFNLGEKRGELSEKDRDYADDMVAFFASELRDGPRPARTPANDPQLTSTGPHVNWIRSLPGEPYGFARDRYWMTERIEDGRTRLVSYGLEKNDREELVTVHDQMGLFDCTSEICVGTEEHPKNVGVASSDDPLTLLFFDRKTKVQRTIDGPWKDQPMVPVHRALSPDSNFFVVGAYNPSGEGNAQYEVLYLVGRDGKIRGPIDLGKGPLSVLDVKPSRVLVRLGYSYPKDSPRRLVTVDPRSLAVTPLAGDAGIDEDDDDRTRPRRSPDRKRSARCVADGSAIVIHDEATGADRTFAVHEDDRRMIQSSCVHWMNERYLSYAGSLSGFLDSDTLKLSTATGPASEGATVEYDETFRYAVSRSMKDTRLGRVVIDGSAP